MNRFFARITAEVKGEKYVPAPESALPYRRHDSDNQEGGVGVAVPAGPRPIRGGAQAKLPALEQPEEPVTSLNAER